MTIGTLDGANVEIRERVGAENFLLFGMTAEEAEAHRGIAGHAAKSVADDPRLARAINDIRNGVFSPDDPARFHSIINNLTGSDYFLVCSDFSDYWRVQRRADRIYRDRTAWTRMTALNTARSGWFSSDRAVRDYMARIWDVEAVSVDE